MATQGLLYRNSLPINDNIKVMIPKIWQILGVSQDGSTVIDEHAEDNYYNMVSMLTAMPIDLLVQLDDAGIDFSSVNEYDLFLMMFGGLKQQDTSLVFGDLDLSKFELAVNQQNGNVVLLDRTNDIVIDRAVHGKIADALRKIHHLKKNRKKPANKEAKEYMIERARKKLQRHKNRTESSQLESLIIAMVNTEQYKYDYRETLGLSVLQFNESVRQIINKVDYDNRMHGVYAGTISIKDLSQDDLNWLIHK